jgi:5-formyltetrahydrofolate cyclo-ligase
MNPESKASVRVEMRRALSALTTEARTTASAEICRQIAAMPEWASGHIIGVFAAQPSEPELSALLDTPGKTFCFPRVSGDALQFHQCPSPDLLIASRWNLMEPDPAQCPMVAAEAIDLLLIPGLAFSRTGGRLGRGGGFYDRFLIGTHPHAVKVGVCFQVQLLDNLPLEAHDHEVDFVVTQSQVVSVCR